MSTDKVLIITANLLIALGWILLLTGYAMNNLTVGITAITVFVIAGIAGLASISVLLYKKEE
ncbi:hypothetical protein 010DV004_25 [Bacillus phage 010DV004]|nr:hypothetical protein 010DV004_25 [Bacillus phage 010DV004]QZA69242.1 hypothetical protein 010DV005_25 [Bacillus phage 010DV005]